MNNQDPYKLFAACYSLGTNGFMREPRKAMLDVCVEYNVRKLLDIGCGTGDFLLLAREKGIWAAGMDMSPSMLKQAGKKKEGDRRIPLVFGDGLNPPFKPGSFDIISYSLILHETSSPPEEILAQGFSVAPLALVLEWKMPERNLDYLFSAWVPIIERMAGKEHFGNYRRFIRQGGIHGLAERVGARIEKSLTMKMGSVVLALLSKPAQ